MENTRRETYLAALVKRESASPYQRRETCEKGWIAVIQAVNPYLTSKTGIFVKEGEADAHLKRNEGISKLAETEDEGWRLEQLVNTVKQTLHNSCFYGGHDNPHYIDLLKITVREILSITGHPIDDSETVTVPMKR